MFNSEQHPMLVTQVRTLQIIVAAMAVGVFVLLAIVLLLPVDVGRQADEEGGPPIITYIATACAFIAGLAGPLVSTIVVAAGRRNLAGSAPQAEATPSPGGASDQALPPGDAGKLIGIFVTKTIIGAAVYEGAALFLCVAYLLEHNPISVILAALFAAGLLVQMPTRDRAQSWLDEQRRQVEHHRQLHQ